MTGMTSIERAARALCSLDNNPENATMDGKPLWRDYLPEVRAVLEALRVPSERVEGDFEHWKYENTSTGINGMPPIFYGEAAGALGALIDAMLGEEQ